MIHAPKELFFVRAQRAAPRFVLAIIILFAGLATGAKQNTQRLQVNQTPLEVRITQPVQWVNGCLSVIIDRINRSEVTLYLPVRGIYMDSSISNFTNGTGESNEQNWINLYGVFDMVSFDATPLAPGATRHDEICYIRPTVRVTNMEKKTIRRIPVRGKLRIDAYFFLTKEDWLRNKTQHGEMGHTAPDSWAKTGRFEPQVARVEAPIPCYDTGCKPACDNPPVVFNGELNFLFTPSEAEWEARGKTINKELARESPSCAETVEPK